MMRVLFAGTPEFAVEHLQGLIEHPDIDVVAVVTQPDRPGKRGKKLIASPVKHRALMAGLTVLQPTRLQAKHLAGFAFDLLIVVAYGQILKPAVLALAAYWPDQRSRITAPTLARRRTRAARYSGRRPNERCDHHEDGRGFGYRTDH